MKTPLSTKEPSTRTPEPVTIGFIGDVARHKTAIGRIALSRPVRLALSDGLIAPDTLFFDYGCGRGDDLRLLSTMGYRGMGWDPVHRPHAPRLPAPVVNLGYVVNVIENPSERQEVLRQAWGLTERVLIVSARLRAELLHLTKAEAYADGYLTGRGTFQKLFDQDELKTWIDHTLATTAVPAAPGVFYAFRDPEDRVGFTASRFRREIVVPRLARSVAHFEDHQPVLQPVMDFFAARGRLPDPDELPESAAVISAFGSFKRAFRLIQSATGAEAWAEIAAKRARDLLIYLALARFEGRPTLSRLPIALQRDMKALFPSYAGACKEADALLFSVGNIDEVNAACAASPIGKRTPEALYVHISALGQLPAVLRVFEGCARAYIGRVEGANLIKLNRLEPKISYLIYPDFEQDPHPVLAQSLSVHLQTFRVRTRDYTEVRSPPVLHRKETFLPSDHPLRAKFARLTAIEESKGLLDESNRIGTRSQWQQVLAEKGLALRGHRLVARR
jgi:DNA phosphorothioation-associated putative methyltransferase